MKKIHLKTAFKQIDTELFIGPGSVDQIDPWIQNQSYTQYILILDQNIEEICLPLIDFNSNALLEAEIIQIPFGEEGKNIETYTSIMETLYELKAHQQTLLIGFGGGAITDITGFVASTYHRGIDFINIPTTLMAQVDASIANKTGINWKNAKNQIGSFYSPKAIFVDPTFLETLPEREIKGGMAEILKYALIQDAQLWEDLSQINTDGIGSIAPTWIERSIEIKQHIVEQDPFDQGVRLCLNFGHTIGHAIESYALQKAWGLSHGECVALGLLAESYISTQLLGLSKNAFLDIQNLIQKHYAYLFSYTFDPEILNFIQFDKKKSATQLKSALIPEIGKFVVVDHVSDKHWKEGLLYLSNLS